MGVRGLGIVKGHHVLEFRVHKKCLVSRARTGEITTSHGKFATPVFMPVGTQGSVRAVSPEELVESGARIILANTYHLYLRPGHRIIEKLGGAAPLYELVWPHPDG